MSAAAPQAAFSAWWEWRCQRYLQDCFGAVEAEVRPQLVQFLFPPAAEPTLPEQSLPLAFVHLRLLAGEELAIVAKRLEHLAGLFGGVGAKPKIGTLYLGLSALTSTPGRLSSLARAQAAFFSLLLRRIAGLLDLGVSEGAIRREFSESWDIRAEEAAIAAQRGARGLWRRSHAARLGLAPLPFDLDAWLAENGLSAEAASARRLFSSAEGHPHLMALAERLAAVRALRQAVARSGDEGRRRACERAADALLESLAGGLEGLTPWEAEALRPSPPLLSSLLAWADRLRLLDEMETPTAHPGRERLPDWLKDFLQAAAPSGGIVSSGRFTVGEDTYLVVGVEATASPEVASVALAPPAQEGRERLDLRLRFGDGTQRSFPYDLTNGNDLLAALRLADQPDIRLDLIIRGEDGVWRFGASLYLVPDGEDRAAWVRFLFEYLYERFGGEEDRIKLAILRGVKE